MAGYIGNKSSVTLVDGYSEAEADAEFVNDPSSVITVSGSNVGIGTVLPSDVLHIVTPSFGGITLECTGATADPTFKFLGASTNYWSLQQDVSDSDSFQFRYNNSEKVRITEGGDLLVSKTSASTGTAGCELRANGKLVGTIDGGNHYFNRLTSDGEIVKFAKDNASVGIIGVLSGDLVVYSTASGHKGVRYANGYWGPTNNSGSLQDNAVDLGTGVYRFDDVYATNFTGTSDITEKQDIAFLTATEMLVAARLSKLFKTFRWKDSVAEKGDNARTHTGTMAQEVQSSFTEEGLDAGDYSLFVSNTWWTHDVEVPAVEAVAEVTDEDGNVTTEAIEAVDSYTRTDTYKTEAEAPEGATSKTRLGLRYTELLAFVGAYNEQRFASIEARLTELEA